MAIAEPKLVLTKYDFGAFEKILSQLDDSGAVISGTVEVGDISLTVRFNDCSHEVVAIEALA